MRYPKREMNRGRGAGSGRWGHFLCALLSFAAVAALFPREVSAVKRLFVPKRWMSLSQDGRFPGGKRVLEVETVQNSFQTDNIIVNIAPRGSGKVATITIHRKDEEERKRRDGSDPDNWVNALSPGTIEDMLNTVLGLPQDVRVLEITGEGKKMFSAGGDLKIAQHLDGTSARIYVTNVHNLEFLLKDLPIFVVGRLLGAQGGALQKATTFDALIALINGIFGVTEARIGMPIGWGMRLIHRVKDPAIAQRLMKSGEPFTGAQGKAWGLFNDAVAEDKLDEAIAPYLDHASFSPSEIMARKVPDLMPFSELVSQRNSFARAFEDGSAQRSIKAALLKLKERKLKRDSAQ